MKISKKDALLWFSFFAQLPPDEPLGVRQTEIVTDTLTQLERAVEKENARLEGEIPGLKTLKGRTKYVGEDALFPAGCKSCLLGSGLSAVRKTNKCNAKCPFCYDFGQLSRIPPIGDGLWEIGGTRFREEDIPLLLDASVRPTGISYVYLEPFMEIEKYYGVIGQFAKAGIHQHMYTNGIACTKENLRSLADAGLDELRFNLGASNCSDRVIENMAQAARHIPAVGIETPMTPAFYEQFMQKKQAILQTGIRFMNCAELHLNENNIGNYEGESMYMCRMGYLSPVWSRQITLKLMKAAAEEKWPIVVHDCSNMTKFARELNLRAKEGGWFGASGYGSEFSRVPFEYLLPALRDEKIVFEEEEELPEGYRVGDIVL